MWSSYSHFYPDLRLDCHGLTPLSKNTELGAVVPKVRGAASEDLAMHLSSSAGSVSPCRWHRAPPPAAGSDPPASAGGTWGPRAGGSTGSRGRAPYLTQLSRNLLCWGWFT